MEIFWRDCFEELKVDFGQARVAHHRVIKLKQQRAFDGAQPLCLVAGHLRRGNIPVLAIKSAKVLGDATEYESLLAFCREEQDLIDHLRQVIHLQRRENPATSERRKRAGWRRT